jgi:RNA polymerase sigma-70 factor (ECF subfamily)
VTEHLPFVEGVLWRFGTPKRDIDDAVQSTFIAASGRIEDIHPGHERGFLFKIARGVAAHVRRSLGRRREVAAEEHEFRDPKMMLTPEYLTHEKQNLQMLESIFARMPPHLRSVFVLHEVEGLTMAEIADTLHIARGTVASRLRSARELFERRTRRLVDSRTAASKWRMMDLEP